MVGKIIVVSGSGSDFGELKKLEIKAEGEIAPWICFINKKYLPEQPTSNNNNLCDEFFDAKFIVISQQENDQKTVEYCVKHALSPIIQNRPGDNIAIIVHDNKAVASHMEGGISLFFLLSKELQKEQFEDILILPFYHEPEDWVYPTLDDFISKVTIHAQKVHNGYKSDFKDALTSLEKLRRKVEEGPDWEKDAADEDLILIVKHQLENDFRGTISKVESFCRKPDKEKFKLMHRFLIEAGALDNAGKLLSDLKSELKTIFPKENPELRKIETSLDRIRSLLDKGYEENGWEPEQLKKFKESIEYLVNKK